MPKPNAPISAVEHIVKAFAGDYCVPGAEDRWNVVFQDQKDTDSVIKLIDMLQGWSAKEHESIDNMVKISKI